MHKRSILRLIVLISALVACFTLAFFGRWSITSIQSSKLRIMISTGPYFMTGQRTPKQPMIAPQSNELSAQNHASVHRGVLAPESHAKQFIHTFFYAWYGTRDVDKSWIHWNHPTLPHW